MGQRVVGLVVGGLLLLAAMAKAHLYLVDPFAVEATLAAREFLWLAIQAEALIGLAMVVGWQRVWTWRAAFVVFGLFLIVNGWQIATAKPSCGCFGQVKVPPKLTLLLDATVLLALVGWWPKATTGGQWLKGVAVATGMLLLNVGLVGGERLLWSHVGTLEAPGPDGWVKLDLDRWAGRRFPLEEEIEEGYRLRFDRWLVVFHQRDCGNCPAVVKRLDRYVRGLTKAEDGYTVLFVDVTNGGGLNTLPPLLCEPTCVRAKLKPGKKWLARTPAIVAVKDGIVQSVTFD